MHKHMIPLLIISSIAIVVAASLIALIIDVLFINNRVIDNIKIDKSIKDLINGNIYKEIIDEIKKLKINGLKFIFSNLYDY